MATEPTSPADQEEPPLAERLAAARAEFVAALRALTVAPDASGPALDVLARGGMFFPAIGLALGALGAGVTIAVRSAGAHGPAAAPCAALVWLAVLGRGAQPLALARGLGRRLGAPALGWIALAALLAVKLLALAALGERALAISLMLAVMLGRWALVVQAYGSIPAPGDALAAAMTRGLKFREFGTASVSAMALTLMLANAVGLVLLLAVASATIGVRIAAHRAAGGVSRDSILAGGELAETIALVACAALARLVAGG